MNAGVDVPTLHSVAILKPGALRLLLALLVVASHMSSLEIGRPAVFVFFMLSGYWVLRMYEEKYAPAAPVWVFYTSRFMRIWLPFASAFALAYVLFYWLGTPKPAHFLWGLSLLGLASTGRDVLGTSWSLDIEIQFYLFVPAVFALLCWAGHARARIVLAVVLTAALTLLGWTLQIRYNLWTFLSYLPAFALGAALWKWKIHCSGRAAAIGAVAFLIIGLATVATPYLRPFLFKTEVAPFHEDWFGMIWVLALFPLLSWNVIQKSSALDMHLGNYSYALYITHWPVIAMLQPALAPVSLADRGLTLVAIMLISALFYATMDRGWEQWRRTLINRLIYNRGSCRKAGSLGRQGADRGEVSSGFKEPGA